jgi:hypothetical protein
MIYPNYDRAKNTANAFLAQWLAIGGTVFAGLGARSHVGWVTIGSCVIAGAGYVLTTYYFHKSM